MAQSLKTEYLKVLKKAISSQGKGAILHAQRVKLFTDLIQKKISSMNLMPNLSKKDLETLSQLPEASYYHDIGKSMIPEEYRIFYDIRTDSGKEIYKTHVDEGFKIFDGTVDFSALNESQAKLMSLILNSILEHHERFDGKGFPNHLSGEEISLAGRITAVADQLDNYLTTTRDKEKISLDLAIDRIQTHKGTRFDPDVINALVFAKNDIEDKLFLLENKSLTEIQETSKRNRPMELMFRPIYDTFTRQINSYEAILKLYDKSYGTIYPLVYMAVAEKEDLVSDITKWCFKELGKSYQNLIKKGVVFENIYIGVSAKYLSKKHAADNLIKILDDYQVNPTKITIELQESLVAGLRIQVVDSLRLLRSRGINTALSNFGSDYSSLSKLEDLDINAIVISSEFADQIVDSIKTREIVRSLVALAKNIDMKVIADGISTKTQEQIMMELGIKVMMGSFYGTYMKERFIRSDVLSSLGV